MKKKTRNTKPPKTMTRRFYEVAENVRHAVDNFAHGANRARCDTTRYADTPRDFVFKPSFAYTCGFWIVQYWRRGRARIRRVRRRVRAAVLDTIRARYAPWVVYSPTYRKPTATSWKLPTPLTGQTLAAHWRERTAHKNARDYCGYVRTRRRRAGEYGRDVRRRA